MKVTPDTKIASIVKANPLALDAIVSISKSFEKLRNPFLFKLMAKRASVQMACKIAGCTFNDFIEKLSPLGYEFEQNTSVSSNEGLLSAKDFPDTTNYEIIRLDVRPIISSGADPLQEILSKVNALTNYQLLEITNTFLPIPLINLLEKQGFDSKIVTQEDELSIVWFIRNNTTRTLDTITEEKDSADWDDCYAKYENKWQLIDVRAMQMPMPMITILEALENLGAQEALFIRHHKVPLFLLPELAERNIEYRIKRKNETEVNLILFHK